MRKRTQDPEPSRDPPPNARLLERLAASYRAATARGRLALDVGPFRAFLSEDSPAYLMSSATPLVPSVGAPADVAVDWPSAIPELRRAFEEHDRTLRLEFFDELAPGLAEALEAAGVPLQLRAKVMALEPAGFHFEATEAPAGTRYLRLEEGHALVVPFLRAQAEAYDMSFDDGMSGWRPLMEKGLADGSLLVAALVAPSSGGGEDVEEVASGASIQLGEGIGELAGVGTPPRWRRRGLAHHLCGRLIADWFAEGGDLCWLSALETGASVYERLGFGSVGTQLNFGLGELS